MKNGKNSIPTLIGVKAIYTNGELLYPDPKAIINDLPDDHDFKKLKCENNSARNYHDAYTGVYHDS
ncbi:MAG: hypothetical protein JXC33_05605 [Deltaproteobacteria bacterium]|nr:hypothetical protein [Deltaproteobacteria bacterium]